jgi:UDP-glucose 4-epimerase
MSGRVVVTGARGGVGQRAVCALATAGHEVIATDQLEPTADYPWGDQVRYVQADLCDAGSAFAVLAGADAVVHAAAIPTPQSHPPHVVFTNNMTSTFNMIEAAVARGVRRFVNVSSETVPGFIFCERPHDPVYLPVDEEHPIRPQDPYALAKAFGEQLMDAAVRRSDVSCVSVRPSWVIHRADYTRYLAPARRDPATMKRNGWSYVDADDLADALVLSVSAEITGHQVLYIASPDNAVGRPLSELVREFYGGSVEIRPHARADASGISCLKAERLLGYRPVRSWRDYLDADEHLAPA